MSGDAQDPLIAAAAAPGREPFESFYAREIRGDLAEMDGDLTRARHMALALVVPGTLAVGAWLGLGVALGSDVVWPKIVGGAGAVLLIGGWSVLKSANRKVKAFLAAAVCRYYGLVYDVDPGPGAVPVDRFDALGLVPGHDRVSLEDSIAGGRDGVRLTVVDANLQEKRHSRRGTHYVTVFRGLLGSFTFPRRFTGTTAVVSDPGIVGRLFAGLAAKGDRVILEDPAFEAVYEVYSTDQVEARYLLTPAFMERALSLAERYGRRRVRFGFQEDRLLLAIDLKRNAFEPGSLLARATDPGRVRAILDDIGMIFDTVDVLGLALKTRA